MDGCQQKKRSDCELNLDFLSSMPSEIITKILVKLPINEAVRTSILSSTWKYLWASIPDLVFEGDMTESTVDKVLLVHRGPILKFELECVHACEEAVGRWLLILSQNGLKDLCLRFHKECKVPLSPFSYHILEHLEFSGCTINAPQCFPGLKLLRSLKLDGCNLVGITIEKFLSSCPLLESLALLDFVEGGCLTILAPNLKQLKLLASFADLSLETPKLISASIFFYYDYLYFCPANYEYKSRLLGTFGQLSNIEELKIGLSFSEYLASGPIPEKLPVTFNHLKKILIVLDDKSEELEAALCIIRNAPILKTLYLVLSGQNIWEEERIKTISLFKQLEVVEIISFADAGPMLGFAKFLLSTAPRLEKLIIAEDNIYNLHDDGAFVMKLESFPRLSSKAVILYDRSCSDDFTTQI